MANVVRKLYRYLSASANRKLDERADPRVQIDQAINEARAQHKALVEQAAAVLGNRRQLEMQIGRQLDEVDTLTDSARQAVLLAEKARAAGNHAEADRYEQTAQTFAGELVSLEASLVDTKSLYDQAVTSAEQARRAVEDNETRLRGQLVERARLLTQLEHTAMQERMSAAMAGMSALEPSGDTPTFAEIRDKIEHRYAVASGRRELASAGVEAKMVEIRRASLEAKASTKLDEIKAAMATARSDGARSDGARSDGARSLPPAATPSLEKGSAAAPPPAGSPPPGSPPAGSEGDGGGQPA